MMQRSSECVLNIVFKIQMTASRWCIIALGNDEELLQFLRILVSEHVPTGPIELFW